SKLTSIGNEAFADCESLDRIFLPSALKSIGTGAFARTALKAVRLSSENSKFRVTDGILYDEKGTALLCYPPGKADESCRIPEGCVRVAREAFAGSKNLVRVFVPDTLTTLEEEAFADCTSLSYCRISAALTSIGAGAFRGTAVSRFIVDGKNKRLKSRDGVLLGNGELVAYPPQKDAAAYTLPEEVTVIGRDAFRGNPYLEQLTLPEGLNWIGEGAFSHCSALQSVSVPSTVSELGAKAFADCSSLTQVRFHPASEIDSIYEDTFRDCSALEQISLPAGVTYVGLYAFAGCAKLTDVTLPDGLVMIAEGAFAHCQSLQSMALPRTVETIGKEAFTDELNKLQVYYDTPAWRWALRHGVEAEILKEPIEVAERTDSQSLIMKVQEALNELGYNCGKPDGKIGRKTRAAIAAFRKDCGLEEAEEIDRALLDALGL
ncbi:MAG: leucine-rich repeat protein, partial [Lachnospiraceae bacterium]|nr:leucine-rich repeat protein [Lachnospiraceae bacterium]